MTETPVHQPDHALPQAKSSRLYQVAAWVVIVAGVVFILAVIFWSGVAMAGHHCYRHHRDMYGNYGPPSVAPPGAGQWLFVFPGGPPMPGISPGMGPGAGPGPGMGPAGPGLGPAAAP
ncbi:MAG: hypothetical protein K2Q25_11195 [Mycobacteriaceae bacterium]|nr:hypothetical protein [Mycobacteriaceae bacterium]